MSLDTKLEKRIDTLYRNTKQMPILVILGFFVPITLVISGPLGLVYWFWRRALLLAADSGTLTLETVPPPIPGARPAGGLSPAAKLDFIRRHKHSLLIPCYMLMAFIVVMSPDLGGRSRHPFASRSAFLFGPGCQDAASHAHRVHRHDAVAICHFLCLSVSLGPDLNYD